MKRSDSLASLPADYCRDLLALSPDGVLIFDVSGNVRDANPATLALLDYSHAELLRRSTSDLVESEPDWTAEFTRLLREEHWEGDVTFRKKGGASVPVEVRAKAMAGPDGPLYVAFLRELTQRQQLEQELRSSEAKYRSLVEHLPAVVYTLANDEQQTTTYFGPQFETLTGVSPEEALEQARRQSWLDFVHPDDRARVIEASRLSDSLGAPFRSEHRIVRSDGSYVWIRDERVPVHDEAGQLVAWQGVYLDISERKAVEDALAASEARFRTAFENAPIGMALVHPDGSFLLGNHALCVMLGYSEEELLGTTFQEITHPDDLEDDLAQMRRALGGELATYALEKRYIRRDGQTIWVRLIASLLRDEAGAPRYFIAQIEDITERRAAETALADERDLLRTLMNHLPDAIYVKDKASRFVRLNPPTARTLGIDDPAEALGKTDFDFFPEEMARQFFADEQRVITTGEALLNRLEPQSEDEADGIWWLTSTAPVRDATGAVVGLVGSGRDVTERLRTEKALQESEARHRAVLAAMPDMVFRLDRAGTYLDYKADRVTELPAPPEAFLGRRVAEVLPADVASVLEATIKRVLASGGTETIEYTLDLSGSLRDFEARLVSVGPDEVVAVVRDVTERNRVNTELREALEAAHAANRATRQFLTMMSHELRTPMQAIMGYAELLLAGPQNSLTPEQVEDVQTIRRGASRLVDLVKQMLDLSRLESGQLELTATAVALPPVIEEVRQGVAPLAATKGLALRIDLPEDLPLVLGDEMGLCQVLLNLAGNAVKYTDQGEVRVSAERIEGEVSITVSDTGIGIAPDVLPHIFDEFRQVHHGTTRKYDGAGLGLTIAKRLAERMGGRLSVASQPGTGSSFTLHLGIAVDLAPHVEHVRVAGEAE
jgi:two-component system, sensor histidine kinase and response regulator